MASLLALGLVLAGCKTDSDDIIGPTLSFQAVAEYMGTADGTTATVVFYSSEAGSYYVQVLKEDAAAPSAPALAANGLTSAVTANTAVTVSITNLTKDTDYKCYVTVKNTAGIYSTVWSDSFTPTKADTVTNPITGTSTGTGTGSYNGYPFTATCVVTGTQNTGTFKTTISGSFPSFDVCEGTYTYIGNPGIWTVTYANSQYTKLKIGDVGISYYDEETGKVKIFNFVDPIANIEFTATE